MPQAVAAAVVNAATAAWSYVSGAFAYVGNAYGAVYGIGTTAAATTGQILTVSAINTAVSLAASIAFAPKVPTPDYTRSVRKQTTPDRVSGYGKCLMGGSYMLDEVDGTNVGNLLNVFAMHDGLIKGWVQYYLHDDPVTVSPFGYVQTGPDLRYGKFSDLIRLDSRRGLPTETNYDQITAIRPDLWPSNARGDGVASLMMIAQGKFKEQFQRDYPNGKPLPRAIGELQYCWDPRLGSRGTITNDSDKEANPHWVGGSQNPALQLLDYMTNEATGMGLPLSRFLSVIDKWIAAANVCDELVPLAAGGTIKRYLAGGAYLHSTPPADVIATILSTFDGWMVEDENGNFAIEAGKYYAPTVVLTDDHIINMTKEFYRPDEQTTNEIVVTFSDPDQLYAEVEADPWRNETDIAHGVIRSQRLQLPWVQSNSQARRLAKIAALKSGAPMRGTITTTLEGLKAWGQRRIAIQAPSEGATVANIVVDCLPLILNPDLTVTIPWTQSIPEAYEWDAATEEGTGSGEPPVDPPAPIPTPIIDDVIPFDSGGGVSRLRVIIRDGLAGSSYIVQWRVFGTSPWTREAEQIALGMTPDAYVETGTVPNEVLEVQVALLTPSGAQSEWSPSFLTVEYLAAEDGDYLVTEGGDLMTPEA